MKTKEPHQINKKEYNHGQALVVLAIILTMALGITFITILIKSYCKLKPQEPISKVDYSQQLEMKENLHNEGRYNTIIFEFDNETVELIY